MNIRTFEQQQGYTRTAHMTGRYKITVQNYEDMLREQDYVCAICHHPEKTKYKRRLSVDHNHETGELRGLLCHHCNTGLGKYNDSPELLEAAAHYIRERT